MSAPGHVPRYTIYDSQGALAVDLERLRRVVGAALPLCLERSATGGGVLREIAELEVSLVDDETIARLHGEFLGDPTPTDVITFDHGEIVVSTETAIARAGEFGNTPDRELALYIVHGLLHLAGYLDKSQAEFERMRDLQEEVLAAVW